MCLQKSFPRSVRADTALFRECLEYLVDSCIVDIDSNLLQLIGNFLASPERVILLHFKNQILEITADRLPTWWFMFPGPEIPDELTLPAQKCIRFNDG